MTACTAPNDLVAWCRARTGVCAGAGCVCAGADGGGCVGADGWDCRPSAGGISRAPSPAVTAQISSPRLDGVLPRSGGGLRSAETTCQDRTTCAHQGVCDITFQGVCAASFELSHDH